MRTLARALALALALTPTLAAPAALAATAVLAFPTAEGYGKHSLGGRGGTVCRVTTLADAGPGTLRDCLARTGPRTVVFRVAGTIVLRSQIKPTSGRLTIAGQTAPGGGIAIRNDPANLTGSPLFLNAPHNVVRHIRLRPGPTSGTKQGTTDAITIDSGAVDTILDHVSLSWASDEPFNSTKAMARLTVQWSLVYEGLSKSTHQSGEHSKCLFAEGDDVTVVRTLMAHCTDRAPNFGVGTRADLVNSVQYNVREKFGQIFSMKRKTTSLRRQSNLLGNWASYGPNTLPGAAPYGADYYPAPYSTNPDVVDIHLMGNIDARRHSASYDERLYLDPADWKYVRPAPVGGGVSVPAADVTSAEQAARDVLDLAGAMPRDAADARVVGTVRGCSGRIIDNPAEVGGWPVLAADAPYPDADADGMDDTWETARGLSASNGDADGDGYTNLEEFLNELAGDQDVAGNPVRRIGAGTGTVPAVNCGIALR